MDAGLESDNQVNVGRACLYVHFPSQRPFSKDRDMLCVLVFAGSSKADAIAHIIAADPHKAFKNEGCSTFDKPHSHLALSFFFYRLRTASASGE